MDQTQVAKLLVSLGCVQVSPASPFTYASGLKGPIYCDNRQILSHPQARSRIIDAFVSAIKKWNQPFDLVAGLATAGIPHAALIADRLNVPMIYIRGSAKGHGKGNQIEGKFKPGDKIIMIEDLVNQGSSLDTAVVAAEAEGLNTEACFSIVDYEMSAAREVSGKHELPLFSLTNFSTIAQFARDEGLIDEAGHKELLNWQVDPAHWKNP